MVNITYNNKTPENFGAWLANIPVVTHSTINRTSWQVPMHDGLIYNKNLYRGDAYIELMVHMRNITWVQSMREVRRWLSETGILRYSDASDAYYEVVGVNLLEEPRLASDYGRLKAQMIIYPYEFLDSGDLAITNPTSITNDYDTCNPEYLIRGTAGASGTLQVGNGSISFIMPSTGELYIDVRRNVASSDGRSIADDKVSGDYSKLKIKHGTTNITLTSGFTLDVTPKWGYYV